MVTRHLSFGVSIIDTSTSPNLPVDFYCYADKSDWALPWWNYLWPVCLDNIFKYGGAMIGYYSFLIFLFNLTNALLYVFMHAYEDGLINLYNSHHWSLSLARACWLVSFLWLLLTEGQIPVLSHTSILSEGDVIYVLIQPLVCTLGSFFGCYDVFACFEHAVRSCIP